MHRILLVLFALMGTLIIAGCTVTTPPAAEKSDAAGKQSSAANDKDEAEIRAALAELDPQDRKLAEAQKWCVVNNNSRLGSMDKPVKIRLEGQPVFLCCGHCRKKAESDPQKYLAKVVELKAKAAAETTTP